MSEKILACPYQCITNKVVSVETENGKEYYVECDCGARGPIAYSSDDAIEMWNAAANALAKKDEEIEKRRALTMKLYLLFLLFLGLKLSGSIDWSWWWVFAPLIVRVVYGLLKELNNKLEEWEDAERLVKLAERLKEIEKKP